MTRYISILRGINVGGKRKVLMTDLKNLYEKLGLLNVTTFIQSGNVIFDLDLKSKGKDINDKIEQAVYKKYGFNVPVIVRSLDEMKIIITANPFLKEKDINLKKLHLTFLSGIPLKPDLENIKSIDYLPDRYSITGKDVFISCSGRYSESKLTNSFFETKLKVSATTRNWNTVCQIFEIAIKN